MHSSDEEVSDSAAGDSVTEPREGTYSNPGLRSTVGFN